MSSEQYQPFPNTHWSLVRRAAGGAGRGAPTNDAHDTAEARRAALTALLTRYEPALKSYLRVVRRLGDEADDILQAFITDKLLEREMLRHADEGRGKFRTFLITSLNNFVASMYRSSGSAPRAVGGGGDTTTDAAVPLAADHAREPSPDEAVEADWARALVRNVLAAMKEKCLADGRLDVWTVFESRVLAEVLEDKDPVPYETLAEQLQLKSPTQAANLLVTGKRLYARLLRVAVSEYERGDRDIESEIADLRTILSRCAPRDPI
jgi:RNA polymerase sigma-70 factor (ECF subfamily)